MKTIILSIVLSGMASTGVYAQCCNRNAEVCDTPATEVCCAETDISQPERMTLMGYISKLKDAYVNMDQGFIMSMLDVDQATMAELYNEFMDAEILNAQIDDVKIKRTGTNPKSYESSFILSRRGYNFSDNKHVTLIWDYSDPNSPKITGVTCKNLNNK